VWTTEYTLRTPASVGSLWQILSDVDGWAQWNDGVETIRLDGPLAAGATFRMKPPGQDELTSTIAELQPNRLLTDVTAVGDLVVRVEHRLDAHPGGGTSITYRVHVTAAASDAEAQEIGRAICADFPEVIAALAAAAMTASRSNAKANRVD
jgi:uncharacterized protein YndB with AHSA1/START domain